jgi:hypothetical protein
MVAHQMVAALRGHRQVDRQTPRQPAASICGSSWSSRPGPIIAPHRRRPARTPTAGRPDILARSWAAQLRLCRRFAAARAPQAHHRRRGGRRRPGACRDPVGRDAGLTCMPPAPGGSPIGATAPASPRTRRSTADTRQDPRDLTVTPRTARRIKSGATACAQPTCVPDPRTSAWRSADPRRSDAVLANRSPAPPRPASTTGEHQEPLTGGSH